MNADLLKVIVYRCPECEFELTSEDNPDDGCPECWSLFVDPVEVDLIVELIDAAGSLGDACRMLSERRPDLQPHVDATLASAHATLAELERL